MPLAVIIAILVLLVLVNALYVAAEFAAVSARRPRVQTLADEGSSSADRLLTYIEDTDKLDRYIAACQVGITLSSLAVGFYGQAQLTPYLGFELSTAVAALIVLIGLTSVQVILGELVPKSVAMRYPERTAMLTVRPLVWSLFILRPLIALLNGSALALLKMMRLEKPSETHAHSPDELEYVFSESAEGGYLDAEEKEMLENALRFEKRLARQIMVPRNQMKSVEVDRDPKEVLQELIETRHMRFPVHEGGVDNMIGFINLKDLFLLTRQEGGDLRDILRELPLFPETNTASEVWDAMRKLKSPIAVLFDEYGGTVGMVTSEDIIEEVVGDVQDEFDDEATRFETEGERVYVRGDVLVSRVNRKFLLRLPTDAADTVGGLVIEALERPPETGDEVTLDDITLKVEAVEDGRVSQVSFNIPDEVDSLKEVDQPT